MTGNNECCGTCKFHVPGEVSGEGDWICNNGEAVIHVGEGVCVICRECGCRTISFVDGNSQGKPCGDAI